MSIRVLVQDHPHRTLALVTETHVLLFKHTRTPHNGLLDATQNTSSTSLPTPNRTRSAETPKCLVEFAPKSAIDLKGFRTLATARGTLGLITLNTDVFVCVITGSTEVATVRPGETVMRIVSVESYCLNRSDYDHAGGYGAGYRDGHSEPNPLPNQVFSTNEHDSGPDYDNPEGAAEHPFNALRKLLNGGTFYYSLNFDLTRRLQDRAEDDSTVDSSSMHDGLLWNSYMIDPLLSFRNRLSPEERDALDHSALLTSVIRGYAGTLTIPTSANPVRTTRSSYPATLTVISRLSSRRAGTRFNSRGIDDNGNVANFVETETIFWSPTGICFSYVQLRGSIPIFWESSASLLPGQQKIQITRSPEATQLSFDRHFGRLARSYGTVHIVNLLSATKPGEVELTDRYRYHVTQSALRKQAVEDESFSRLEQSNDGLLRETEFDFHERSRAAGGYDGARQIRPLIDASAESFVYFLTQEIIEEVEAKKPANIPVMVMQQNGVFRVNCLDCLDRTNLVQGIISQMAIELFLEHRGEIASSSNLSIFWLRHSSLWADNGDALSKIYAGTGALKSSFTRHGKMSLGGLMADARKSATRLYVNHFEDKGRQNTIDLLLGRLVGQEEVELVDPINDWVQDQLKRKVADYESHEKLRIWVGTYNLNGRMMGDASQLGLWLDVRRQQGYDVVAVGFQEIVELSPQQIMSTDPGRRLVWEKAVRDSINEEQDEQSEERYVLLRSGQLVGAALLIYVKAKALHKIRNVEGAIKKTGMSGVAGNKGAVAIRMDVQGTSLCFVTAHLAAGFGNDEERNRDYATIVAGLRFQRDRRIEDHEVVIWAGDFNYRIGLNHERTTSLINSYKAASGRGDKAAHAMQRLYENDQLNIQMVAGHTFPFYREGRIKFLPTYKFDLGRDDYDTSEKARIPAWTDRIVWRVDPNKGSDMKQLEYDSVQDLRFSDHRPVFSTFEIDVRVVNEKKRSELLTTLYEKRKADVREGIEDESSASEDAEDLMGYQSVAPGLPPASSDRRKWWLDGDRPAQSGISAPKESLVLNETRSGNPWRTNGEDEWVEIDRRVPTAKNGAMSKPELPAPRRQPKKPMDPTTDGSPVQQSAQEGESETETRRPPRPPPPRNGSQSQLRSQSPLMAGAWPPSRNVSLAGAGPASSLARTPSVASMASSTAKSPPPPKPLKPSTLTAAKSNPDSVSIPVASPPPEPAVSNTTGTSRSQGAKSPDLSPRSRSSTASLISFDDAMSTRGSASSPVTVPPPSQRFKPTSTLESKMETPPPLPRRTNTMASSRSVSLLEDDGASSRDDNPGRVSLVAGARSGAGTGGSVSRSSTVRKLPPPLIPSTPTAAVSRTPSSGTGMAERGGLHQEARGPPLPPRRE